MPASLPKPIDQVFRWLRIAVLAGVCGIFAGFFWGSQTPVLLVEMQVGKAGLGQVFWNTGKGMIEEQSIHFHVHGGPQFETYRIPLPFGPMRSFRLDPIDEATEIQIRSVRFRYVEGERAVDLRLPSFSPEIQSVGGVGRYTSTGHDPFLIFPDVPQAGATLWPRFLWLPFLLATAGIGAVLWVGERHLVAFAAQRSRAMVAVYAVAVVTAIVVSGGTAQLPSDGAWFRDYFDSSIYELPGIRAILTPVLLRLTNDNLERFIALQVAFAACVPLLVFLTLDRVGDRLSAFYWALVSAIFLEWHAFSEVVLSESISVGLVAATIWLSLECAHAPTLGRRLGLALCFFVLPLAQFRLVILAAPVAALLLFSGSLRGQPAAVLRRLGAPLAVALGLGIFANYYASYLIVGRFVSFTTYGLANHALGMAAKSPEIFAAAAQAGDPAARALHETVTQSPGAAVTIQVQTAIGKLSRAENIPQDEAARRLNRVGRSLALLHPALYLSDAAEVARQYLFRQPWMIWAYYESQKTELGPYTLPLSRIDEAQKRLVVVLGAVGLVVFFVRWRWSGAPAAQGAAVLFIAAILLIDLGVSCLLEYSNYEHARYWITASPAYLLVAAIGLTPWGRAQPADGETA